MRHPLIRQGEGPIASSDRIHREHTAYRKNLDRIYLESPELHSTHVGRGTAGGDSRKLRGIPAIGRNVTGAIPGTVPHKAGD